MRIMHVASGWQGLLVTCLFPDNRNFQSEGMINICLPIRKMMETIDVSASYSRKLDRELFSL